MALRESLERQDMWLFRWRSYLPLLLIPLMLIALRNAEIIEKVLGDDIGDMWETFAFAISFLGFIIRCITAGYVPRGTSGCNTKTQAASVLNTTGMYSITRNPLYLGNFLIIFGITLFIQVWWLAFITWIGYWFYYERIVFTEEEFLRQKFGKEFIDWAAKTPMYIPNLKNWRKSQLPFSFKTVLRREFHTYFAIAIVYFFIELADNFFTREHLSVFEPLFIFFLLSLAIYLVLLILKKKTNVLNVKGR